MAEHFRMVVAVIGNVASVSLYAAPTVTFKRVIRKKSTEEFSCIPYIIGLLNCLLFTWYGLPVVSNKWENFPLVTVNGVGIVFELSYVLIYFWYSSAKQKVKVATTAIPVILVFCAIALVSAFNFPDHRHRKLLVGSVGLGVAVAMYASPLVAMKKVIQTKSVEFMPLPLSLCSFLASVLWLTYGLLIQDIFVAGPSLVGTPLSILQLVLHCKYWKRREMKEPINNKVELHKENMEKLDLEKGGLFETKDIEEKNVTILNNDINSKNMTM
ncbi:bidirectional sugar transporter SWEET3-like [Lotus japonicus]|uniref:Bidirectional sugar transporter SWEET n=1 Tax=Lotus japonicus TaxID=34305 RepID=I3SYF2_LOTJA|nr:bidirectional sugar transporter SWEET3-like [Lotus japonicus]AFK45294.1 unknown [Lotus japonicus]BBA57100.1 sugar transporter [Lotus japonicus]